MLVGIKSEVDTEKGTVNVNFHEETEVNGFVNILITVMNQVILNYPKYSKSLESVMDNFNIDKDQALREDIESGYIIDANVTISSVFAILAEISEYTPTSLAYDFNLTEVTQQGGFPVLDTRTTANIEIKFTSEEEKNDDYFFDQLLKSVFNVYVALIFTDVYEHFNQLGESEVTEDRIITHMENRLNVDDTYLDNPDFITTLNFVYYQLLSTLRDLGLELNDVDENVIQEMLVEK